MSSLNSYTTQLKASQQYMADVLQPRLERAEADLAALEAQIALARAVRDKITAQYTELHAEITGFQAKIKELTPVHPAVPQVAPLEKIDRWSKKSFTAVSLDQQNNIAKKIDDGEIESEVTSIQKAGSWHTKHYPTAHFPSKILKAIRDNNGPISFADLLTATDMTTKGEHCLQNYLRELNIMRLIRVLH